MDKITLFIAILCTASIGCARSATYFNVADFGAIGNGRTDDTQAFLKAWRATCSDKGERPTLLIPARGTFLVKPVQFVGPCKSNPIHIQVKGNLVAPSTISEWSGAPEWFFFRLVKGLVIEGTGRIGGQGSIWWPCKTHPDMECPVIPSAFSFSHCDGLHLHGLTFFNNPGKHIIVASSNGVFISNLVITAPEGSPNTDGINIGYSRNVYIWNSVIGTGDDCISVVTDTSDVYISGIKCGPGHGISIGSLGRDGSFANVERIFVKNSILSGTTNGARIKTWQGGRGSVRDVSFENIQMKAVYNPIIIDQYYCDRSTPCHNHTSAVSLGHLRFSKISGTSSSEVAVKLACSESVPCTNVVLDSVQLTPAIRGMNLSSYCLSVYGPRCDDCTPALHLH